MKEKKMAFAEDAHDLALPADTPTEVILPVKGKIRVLHPLQDRVVLPPKPPNPDDPFEGLSKT